MCAPKTSNDHASMVNAKHPPPSFLLPLSPPKLICTHGDITKASCCKMSKMKKLLLTTWIFLVLFSIHSLMVSINVSLRYFCFSLSLSLSSLSLSSLSLSLSLSLFSSLSLSLSLSLILNLRKAWGNFLPL